MKRYCPFQRNTAWTTTMLGGIAVVGNGAGKAALMGVSESIS